MHYSHPCSEEEQSGAERRIPKLSLDDLRQDGVTHDVGSAIWGMLVDEGYFLLVDLPKDLLDLCGAWRAMEAFFSRPIEEKNRFHIGNSTAHFGFVPRGEEGGLGEAADVRESFDCGWDWGDATASSLRRSLPLDLADHFDPIYEQLQNLGDVLARVLSELLRQDSNHLSDRARTAPAQLRLLSYPPTPLVAPGSSWHTDYECFTLLVASAPGLQVLNRNGKPRLVHHEPNSVVVTIGDLVEVMTNGGIKATVHGVGHLPYQRYSMAYFYALDWETLVSPFSDFVQDGVTHYPNLVSGDHLLQRTNAGFEYRRARPDLAVRRSDNSSWFYDRHYGDGPS